LEKCISSFDELSALSEELDGFLDGYGHLYICAVLLQAYIDVSIRVLHRTDNLFRSFQGNVFTISIFRFLRMRFLFQDTKQIDFFRGIAFCNVELLRFTGILAFRKIRKLRFVLSRENDVSALKKYLL